ncbi:MAG: hypothetical protein D6731_07095 [Planctomycetota bacterium]|nr:MAG: hypothetical protein D6731_07095 [Planctomycetota bacterium]
MRSWWPPPQRGLLEARGAADPHRALGVAAGTGGTGPANRSRILFGDADAFGAWQPEESWDGRADSVFWGLRARALAEAVGVPS